MDPASELANLKFTPRSSAWKHMQRFERLCDQAYPRATDAGKWYLADNHPLADEERANHLQEPVCQNDRHQQPHLGQPPGRHDAGPMADGTEYVFRFLMIENTAN